MSTKRNIKNCSRSSSKPYTMKSGESRMDSERDSGFSDVSSEHMGAMDTTDSEESLRSVVRHGTHGSASGTQSSQLAVVGGSYSNISPMIIMNNVLLKQPGDNPPALKPWGFGSSMEVVQHPQVVFLQPVVSHQRSSTSKEAPLRRRRSKKYLPILKSYPKIAPHPGDGSASSGRGTSSSASSSCSSSLSSSSSSSSDKISGLVPSQQDHCQRDKRWTGRSAGGSSSVSTTSSLPHLTSSVSPQLDSPPESVETSTRDCETIERVASVISPPELPTSSSLTPSNHSNCFGNDTLLRQAHSPAISFLSENGHADGKDDSRRKRFCNTYNILSRSGLLDITLRTKELLRQNRRTQSDLDKLKEQTKLFLQALQTGDASIFVKLQASLQEGEQQGDSQGDCEPD